MTTSELGRLVRQYDTDIRARRMRVVLAVCTGALWSTAASTLAIIAYAESNPFLVFGTVLFFPATICLGSGVSRWLRIEGIEQERIERYKQGIVLLRNNASMVVRWSDIDDIGWRVLRPSSLLRISGVDPEYTVILKDGHSFWFDSNTDGWEDLAGSIMAALTEVTALRRGEG
ncbi:hypothetical protein [Actinomadura rubrisoli]|uniref:YcxB family protein n=1 Tax=Actinomadura rubrisoli TaxID=2530368 RepID=A0A4R5B2Y2_9ACTN|nr:hypothetical protein [Actinomadura rubrisoli]TDD80478.1 hypothetical protein E1298_25770 [Actinomadura rubrisoli]